MYCSKITLVLIIALLSTGNAQAGPKHVLTAYPRAVARAAKNMVTFKDKAAAFQQWVTVGVMVAEVASTTAVMRACSRCVEKNAWYLGKRPTLGPRLVLTAVGVTMSYNALTQYGHESLDGDPNRFVRNYPWLWMGQIVGMHGFMGARHNWRLRHKCLAAELRCN